MTNPSDSPREARIRERFAHLLKAAQFSEPALFGHDLEAFVRDLRFNLTAPGVRPQFDIVSSNLQPNAVMELAGRAVDEIFDEDQASP